MSLTGEDIEVIQDAIQPVIAGVISHLIAKPLKNIATSHSLAVQLIRDTTDQLEACKLKLDALALEKSRVEHLEVDAETAIQLWRDLAERHKNRVEVLEVKLTEKQAEINSLRRGNDC